MPRSSPLLFGIALLLLAPVFVHGQKLSTSPCTSGEQGSGSWWQGHSTGACELRRAILPVQNGHISVHGVNGEIEVAGEDRQDIALEARVTAQGSSRESAEQLLHQVRIETTDGIRAEGPQNSGWFHNGGWAVSYKLRVPRRVALQLETTNGGISVARVGGEVNASSTNGGLSLHDLSGTVQAETTNGGIDIALSGDRWQGSGLRASSTNGGIHVHAPAQFAAHLVAETTNGGISVGFPLKHEGKIEHHVDADINGGGPAVALQTTNGGISVSPN